MEGHISKKNFNQNLARFDFTTDESDYEYEFDDYEEESYTEEITEEHYQEDRYAYEDWLDYKAFTADRYYIDDYDYAEYINDSKEILRYLKEKEEGSTE